MAIPEADIPEDFFQCSLCSDILQEPKLLSCLHRYCRDCLVKRSHDAHGMMCPTCNVVTALPANGVAGLETDVHTKQLIECHEARSNILKDKKKRACSICSKHKRCSSYCFKCTGFLCEDCHHLHLSNGKFKLHSAALINVKNVDGNTLKLAFDELTRLMDAPRCHTHPTLFLDIICKTCDKMDICMACKFGSHEKHDIESIKDAAKRVREELRTEMGSLEKPEGFWKALKDGVNKADSRMTTMVASRLHEAEEKVKQDVNVILAKKEYLKEIKEKNMSLDSSEGGDVSSSFTSGIGEDDVDFAKFTEQRMDIEKFNDALVRFLENVKGSKFALIKDAVMNLQNRYANISTTTKSVLNTEHDWAALKCVSTITDVMKSLRFDIQDILRKVGFLEKIDTKFIPSPNLQHFGLVEVIGTEHGHVNLEGFASKEWIVRGVCYMVGVSGVVLSSHNTRNVSQITQFSSSGEKLGNLQFHGEIPKPWRFVDAVTKTTVVTACQPSELGLVNLVDGSYNKRDLCQIVHDWSRKRWVQSMAVCKTTQQIFIGSGETDGIRITGSNKIEILDLQYNHIKTLNIPQIKVCPQSLAVSRGQILICDYYGKLALCCGMDGSLHFIFPNLELDEGDWQPFSICADRQGYVYILWDAKVAENWKQIIIRYTPVGQPLTMRVVDLDAMCITITDAEGGNERLAVVAREKGEVTHYALL